MMQSALFRATRAPSVGFRHGNRFLRPLAFTRTLITKKYTVEHEMIAFDDATGVGTVHITEYAQSSLGDVVFVELPPVGKSVSKGDTIGAVESVKAASDIYAPVTGTVEQINEALNNQPNLLNKSPEEHGWLCKIKLKSPDELDALLSPEKYKTEING